MNKIIFLRRLAMQQQFELLYESCVDAQTAAGQVLLALACAALDDAGAARRCLAVLDETVLDETVLDVDTRIDLAAVYLLLGDISTARILLQRALSEAPQHALLLARLAVCEQQQPELAQQLFAQSLQLQPAITVYLNFMRSLLHSGQWQQAEQLLATADAFWLTEQLHWPVPQAANISGQLRLLRLQLWLLQGEFFRADLWLQAQYPLLNAEEGCELLLCYSRQLTAHVTGHCHYAEAEDALYRGLICYPQQGELAEALAELAMVQGQGSVALRWIQKAIRLVAGHGQPVLAQQLKLATIASVYDPVLARAVAEQLLNDAGNQYPQGGGQYDYWQIQAQLVLTGLALAEMAPQSQYGTAAEAVYRGVLQCYPQSGLALQGLAQLYLQQRRAEDAIALFEQLCQRDPACAYKALTTVRHFPQDTATLLQLEALICRSECDNRLRSGMLLQLARGWEKQKNYRKAFMLADEANKNRALLWQYDNTAHRQQCARIRYAFSQSLFKHRSGYGVASRLPVFVVGMPGSGAEQVEQILARHSCIGSAGELAVIPRIIAGLERYEKLNGSGRAYPDCIDDLSPAVAAGIARQILHELQQYAPDAAYVINSLPHNFRHIGLIKLLLPGARIISVRRDPRDIAITNYFSFSPARDGTMGFACNLDWIGEQLADHNLLMHHWQQVFQGDILEVQYERLQAAPETETRRMLEHIGADWEEPLCQSETAGPVVSWLCYESHLSPLIAATNRRIVWQPITDMVSLPEPGLLHDAAAYYRQGKPDEAERSIQMLLHHLPQHAAARFLLGVIWADKGHMTDGIAQVQFATERCPWQHAWQQDLALMQQQQLPVAGRLAPDMNDNKEYAT